MTIAQKRAISYAISERSKKRREQYIIEKEGDLKAFEKSKYKSMFWYIFTKYNERIH